MLMQLPDSAVCQWKLSKPLGHCPAGFSPETLRRILALDSQLELRWSPDVNTITIWRWNSNFSVPVLQAHNPYGMHLDNRLLEAMRAGDNARKDRKRRYMERMAARHQLAQERARAELDKGDHDRLHWEFCRGPWRETDGNPRRLFAQVHRNTPVGSA